MTHAGSHSSPITAHLQPNISPQKLDCTQDLPSWSAGGLSHMMVVQISRISWSQKKNTDENIDTKPESESTNDPKLDYTLSKGVT